LKRLLDKKLVRIMGRKDVPGKPIMYGTTKKFLEIFSLKDLSELPTLKELTDLQDGADDSGTESQMPDNEEI
jgi:segregation and condensation protein B